VALSIWLTREPVRRRVALKVIKLGMDTEQLFARFEAERQALAMMTIRISPGSPMLERPTKAVLSSSMELVRGVPITKYLR